MKENEIKKGDMVYVKSNKGLQMFDELIGQIFEVVSDKYPQIVSNRDGSIFTGIVVEISNEFVKNKYPDKPVVSTLDELVKVSPPSSDLQEQKEKELEPELQN